MAAHFGQYESIRTLLSEGACIEARRQSDWGPYVKNGTDVVENMVRALYQERDKLDMHNLVGSTPLLRAANNNYGRVVDLLLNCGADIEARTFKGETASSLAADRGDAIMVRQLLIFGANPNARSEVYSESKVTHGLLTYSESLEVPSTGGKTPLILAAIRGHPSVIKLLLAHGAEHKARATHTETALGAAANAGHVNIVQLLLERGAAIESTSQSGGTPLLKASTPSIVNWSDEEISRLLRTIQLLVESGATLKERGFFDRTALARAAEAAIVNPWCGFFSGKEPMSTPETTNGIHHGA
ncbi:ankyrin repeat-containing domain protein [Aspergillus heterothallicus]